ncbi:MAG: hypothetical protein WC856_02135 [Methylococcaceae bacterium]
MIVYYFVPARGVDRRKKGSINADKVREIARRDYGITKIHSCRINEFDGYLMSSDWN